LRGRRPDEEANTALEVSLLDDFSSDTNHNEGGREIFQTDPRTTFPDRPSDALPRQLDSPDSWLLRFEHVDELWPWPFTDLETGVEGGNSFMYPLGVD
jgi:hypothetical protein